MKDDQRHFEIVGVEIAVELGDLRREQQALVNDRARRQRRHVGFEAGLARFAFEFFARQIELQFKLLM